MRASRIKFGENAAKIKKDAGRDVSKDHRVDEAEALREPGSDRIRKCTQRACPEKEHACCCKRHVKTLE